MTEEHAHEYCFGSRFSSGINILGATVETPCLTGRPATLLVERCVAPSFVVLLNPAVVLTITVNYTSAAGYNRAGRVILKRLICGYLHNRNHGTKTDYEVSQGDMDRETKS